MIPADQIPPPGIPNMHRPRAVYCLLDRRGLTAGRLNVSLQQVEQRVQRSSCWLQAAGFITTALLV